MSRFVVVVDTQWDFMAGEGALSVAGAAALVGPMQAWLSALKPAEVAGVLFTFDTHFRETYAASPEAKMFPIHCVRETPGWANMLDITLLDPAIPAWRIEKGVFDMWAEPGLAEMVRRLPAKSSTATVSICRSIPRVRPAGTVTAKPRSTRPSTAQRTQ